MSINEQYEQLAKQLGDVVYKIVLLEQHKENLLKQIKALDELAGKLKEQQNEQEKKNPQSSPAGTNSTP